MCRFCNRELPPVLPASSVQLAGGIRANRTAGRLLKFMLIGGVFCVALFLFCGAFTPGLMKEMMGALAKHQVENQRMKDAKTAPSVSSPSSSKVSTPQDVIDYRHGAKLIIQYSVDKNQTTIYQYIPAKDAHHKEPPLKPDLIVAGQTMKGNHTFEFFDMVSFEGRKPSRIPTNTSLALAGNRALYGGGANYGTLINCSLVGNSATWEGGGVFDATLNNCTLTGNSAGRRGGGVKYCTVNNSIVYHNNALDEPNFSGFSPPGLSYSCTQPMPEGGTGNITAEPQLTDSAHISATSPCKGTGSSGFVSGVDIDGEVWLNPPSMGCDEFNAGAVTDAFSVSIKLDYSNVGRQESQSAVGGVAGN